MLPFILQLLPVVGKATAALPEFKRIYDQLVATLGEQDQATAQEAYADLMADNDEGHRRLQAKLRAAAGE